MILFIFLYRILYPLVILFLNIGRPFSLKLQNFLDMRKKQNGHYPWHITDYENCILIHAASGEFEYAKPVIRELLRQNKKVLLTYFSPSYKKQIEEFPGIKSCPIPWDYPALMLQFLKTVRPQAILITRTDFWYFFLRSAQILKIPIYLYSATLDLKSSKTKNPLLKKYYQKIYAMMNRIYCVTLEDENNFKKIFKLPYVETAGDTRFDQVLFRLQHPKLLKHQLLETSTDEETQKFIFIAGSTWPEDEHIIIGLTKELLKNSIQVILAPHEPSPVHLKTLQALLKAQNIASTYYTQSENWASDEVLIIDQIGILADLYQWAHWAFIGGSFKKQVHSVMEALAQGCYTFVGPYHFNNREALDFQKVIIPLDKEGILKISAVQSFSKKSEILDKILKTQNLKTLKTLQSHIQNSVRCRAGVSVVLTQKILESIGNRN